MPTKRTTGNPLLDATETEFPTVLETALQSSDCQDAIAELIETSSYPIDRRVLAVAATTRTGIPSARVKAALETVVTRMTDNKNALIAAAVSLAKNLGSASSNLLIQQVNSQSQEVRYHIAELLAWIGSTDIYSVMSEQWKREVTRFKRSKSPMQFPIVSFDALYLLRNSNGEVEKASWVGQLREAVDRAPDGQRRWLMGSPLGTVLRGSPPEANDAHWDAAVTSFMADRLLPSLG